MTLWVFPFLAVVLLVALLGWAVTAAYEAGRAAGRREGP